MDWKTDCFFVVGGDKVIVHAMSKISVKIEKMVQMMHIYLNMYIYMPTFEPFSY